MSFNKKKGKANNDPRGDTRGAEKDTGTYKYYTHAQERVGGPISLFKSVSTTTIFSKKRENSSRYVLLIVHRCR